MISWIDGREEVMVRRILMSAIMMDGDQGDAEDMLPVSLKRTGTMM